MREPYLGKVNWTFEAHSDNLKAGHFPQLREKPLKFNL
jgi:hypothetical protein